MGNGKLVAGQRQKQRFSVAITTDQYQKVINNTLRDPDRASRFIASITSAVAVNPQLQDCDAGSILAGALLGESLNLSPSPQLGQYYLVPFETTLKDENGRTLYLKDENGKDVLDGNGRKVKITEKKAQFILGYSGYLQLAIRSGQYKDIDVMEIKQGEYRGKDKETGKPVFSFIEDDEEREELPTVGYMAYYEYLNGFRKVIYWSKDKMVRHADKYSPAFNKDEIEGKKVSFADYESGNYPKADEWKYSSMWYKDFDAMAKKTMLRQLISKWGMLSVEMQKAVIGDDAVAMVDDKGILTTDNVVAEVDVSDIKPEFDGVAKQVNLDDL